MKFKKKLKIVSLDEKDWEKILVGTDFNNFVIHFYRGIMAKAGYDYEKIKVLDRVINPKGFYVGNSISSRFSEEGRKKSGFDWPWGGLLSPRTSKLKEDPNIKPNEIYLADNFVTKRR